MIACPICGEYFDEEVGLCACQKEPTSETLLRWAEVALTDIRERVEHAGTDRQCRDEVGKICADYWKYKSNAKLTNGGPQDER